MDPASARVKTLTFAAVHMAVAFAVGYALTGSLAMGGALALVEPLVNTVAYYLHELAWSARRRPPRGRSSAAAHG